MISDKEATRISKFLSLVLRHQPETIGITLDDNGWADVNTLLQQINAHGTAINHDVLEHIVATNSKKRFAFDETHTRIRASQGHSISVDLAYTPVQPPEILYHGTASQYLASILKTGLEKRNRQHVHLSADIITATKVGQRHGKPKVLAIYTKRMYQDGYNFYLSDNGVWLTDHVPAQYIQANEQTSLG